MVNLAGQTSVVGSVFSLLSELHATKIELRLKSETNAVTRRGDMILLWLRQTLAESMKVG